MSEKICKWCGKPISGRRQYCNDDCWKEVTKANARNAYRAKKGLVELTVTCKWCGEEFKTYKTNQEYCCEDHRYAAELKRNIEKARAKTTYSKICKHCGEPFDTEDHRARYCCKECSDENKRKMAREREAVRIRKPKKKKKREGLTAAKTKAIRDQGMTYAEWQMKQTLSMIEPIRTVL